MFGWEYPPRHSGGLGVACQGLVNGLLKSGVHVTLVLPHDDARSDGNLTVRYPTEDICSTVRVASILQPYDSEEEYFARLLMRSIPRERGHLYGPDLGSAVEGFAAMAVEMTKDVQTDVVHCHDWMTYEAGMRAARHHRKPFVAHIHATEFDRTDFHPNEWIAARERKGLLAADRVIAVSNYTKNMLTGHYGIPGDKITIVHNGHDVATDRLPDSITDGRRAHIPLVLFLGRLTLQKNPRQFLEVARIVKNHRPDVQFAMAGDGPMLVELIDRSVELGLSENVVFTGKVTNSEARALYSAADCFVMPSLSEPFGLVALEAIAHGTPVIISKQSGVAEVVDHAFKVDFWDTEKMADCLLTILREDALALQLKTEAPKILQKLTWAHQASHVKSLYTNLLSQPR